MCLYKYEYLLKNIQKYIIGWSFFTLLKFCFTLWMYYFLKDPFNIFYKRKSSTRVKNHPLNIWQISFLVLSHLVSLSEIHYQPNQTSHFSSTSEELKKWKTQISWPSPDFSVTFLCISGDKTGGWYWVLEGTEGQEPSISPPLPPNPALECHLTCHDCF